MVRFLLENSLGAWWVKRYPESPLVREWGYLRVDGDGSPAAGEFEQWPDRVADVTVMGPCCGSGHFLVEAFSMLWQMRAEEEGLPPVVAQDAVLQDNLFGLELDPRCVQIAKFSIAVRAWRDGSAWRQLPVLNIACSGIPIKASIDEWRYLANGDQRVESALTRLYTLFRNADTLGSLVEPRRTIELACSSDAQLSLEAADWHQVEPLLESALSHESVDPGTTVLGSDAMGAARAASYLSRRYTLVVTNPPFLGRSKQADDLTTYVDRFHPASKPDLALTVMQRSLAMCEPNGSIAFVTPQTWLQLKRSTGLRKEILRDFRMFGCAWLGSGAFETILGEVVKVALVFVSVERPRQDDTMFVLDCQDLPTISAKRQGLANLELKHVGLLDQYENSDSRILVSSMKGPSIADVGDSHQGIKTSDNPRFIRFFWEMPRIEAGWRRMQSAPDETDYFAGRSEIAFWEDGQGAMANVTQEGATFRGRAAWGRAGLVIRQMGTLPATLYTGELFDGTGTVVVAREPSDLAALWAFCSSDEFHSAVRSIDSSLTVTTGTILSVPMDVEHWRRVAVRDFPTGLPAPGSGDPTQWLFEGRPEFSTVPLQVAVARLLGYRWPGQSEADDLDGLADEDAIVCLPSVLGERAAGDRLWELLARAFDVTWSPAKSAELLATSGSSKNDLASWLRDDFFRAHCKVFGNRPFIWHIWDGRKDGFAALVNYHRLDRATLERLTYTYLGDWIERQIANVREGAVGADGRLAAAQHLKRQLEQILDGNPPYDIYVRWKSLAEQPLGWEPDLNDGVRLNVRPFVEAEVLRSRFSVKWGKDRGKNPDGSERQNDLHFARAEKEALRTGTQR